VNFAVSPDGGAVTYVISSQMGGEWSFHSLWLRSLGSPLHLQVDTGSLPGISGMWWAGSGIVWRSAEPDGPILFFEDARTPRTVIWEPADVPVATPGATPIASPEAEFATPVATPGATPIASPGAKFATPVASPIASPQASLGATPLASPVR
jgi:hypothetical protein